MQSPLQQTPEVFHPVGMNLAVHVLDRMIDDSVIVFCAQSIVGLQFIAIDGSASFNVLTNLRLQSRLTAVIHNECPHVTAALHHAHDHGFIFSASTSDDAGTL